jgi:hypothetical protein
MRALVLTALLMLTTEAASAGSITLDFGAPVTITTTAQQDAALARIRQHLNASLPAAEQHATTEAMLRSILVSAIASYRDQAATLHRDDACTHYRALTAAQRATVDANFGPPGQPKSPCP